MSSCWEVEPHSRPSFSQITKLLYQSSILEDVAHKNKRKMSSGKEDSSLEGTTVYTHVLSSTSMYDKYREIQSSNSSYMKMDGQIFHLNNNENNEDTNEEEQDNPISQETESLQKPDIHTSYCHYLTLKKPQRAGSIQSVHDTDSGASTDHNASVFTETFFSEITSNSPCDNLKIGRLQSLNEVEESNQC